MPVRHRQRREALHVGQRRHSRPGGRKRQAVRMSGGILRDVPQPFESYVEQQFHVAEHHDRHFLSDPLIEERLPSWDATDCHRSWEAPASHRRGLVLVHRQRTVGERCKRSSRRPGRQGHGARVTPGSAPVYPAAGHASRVAFDLVPASPEIAQRLWRTSGPSACSKIEQRNRARLRDLAVGSLADNLGLSSPCRRRCSGAADVVQVSTGMN